MDAKQQALALIEFLLMTLRKDMDSYGRYESGAAHRLDLAFTSIQARLLNGEYDKETSKFRLSPKSQMMMFCQLMVMSLGMEKNPRSHQIENATDGRIYEVFSNTLGRLKDGDFDQVLDVFVSMAVS